VKAIRWLRPIEAAQEARAVLNSITHSAFGTLALLAALLAAAFLVLARVRSDYETQGRLSRPVAFSQFAYFCVYALASYAFLDSRPSRVNTANLAFPVSVALMLLGVLLVLFSMPFLGWRSFGREVGRLRTSGLYRYSRNPQLVRGFVFIVGYAMLWPSWTSALWASLWLVIAPLMVRAEEAHLKRVFGDEYRDYCAHTPRYLGRIKD
jgi:protein-S-isoprenylcysteine O-methyltransferase Ste14